MTDSFRTIPDMCQFWPVKLHQQVSKFATKTLKWAKIGKNFTKKYIGLKKAH